MTTTNNIERKRGDTRRITFSLMDGASVVDISQWTDFRLTVDPNKAPEDDSTKVSEIDGTLSTDGTDGRVYFIPTGLIPAGAYFYDAQAIDSNGEKTTFSEGKYKVTQDITKD